MKLESQVLADEPHKRWSFTSQGRIAGQLLPNTVKRVPSGHPKLSTVSLTVKFRGGEWGRRQWSQVMCVLTWVVGFCSPGGEKTRDCFAFFTLENGVNNLYVVVASMPQSLTVNDARHTKLWWGRALAIPDWPPRFQRAAEPQYMSSLPQGTNSKKIWTRRTHETSMYIRFGQ